MSEDFVLMKTIKENFIDVSRAAVFLLLLFDFYWAYADVYRCKDALGQNLFTDDKKNCNSNPDGSVSGVSQEISMPDIFFDDIPDLLQSRAPGGFPNQGKYYCGPVAASNALVWLEGRFDESYQVGVANKLGSVKYMHTDPKEGTHTSDFLQGIGKYAKEKWGGYRSLEYHGLKNVKKSIRYEVFSAKPSVYIVRSGLSEKSAVWLSVAFSKYNPIKGIYRRVEGHWLTVVGVKGEKLIINDSAARAGRNFKNQLVSLDYTEDSYLYSKSYGELVASDGLMKMMDGMYFPGEKAHAFVDGIVILRL